MTLTIKSSWESLQASSHRLRGEKHKWAPPASELEITDLEEYIGNDLPEELKESLRVHNGDVHLGLLSCEEIKNEHEIQLEVFDDAVNQDYCSGTRPDPAIKHMYWNSFWVPITKDKVDNLVCIDMDPTPEGKLGQIIIWKHDGDCKVVADCLNDFMKLLADRYSTCRLPFDTAQRLKNADKGLASSW